MAEQSLDTVEVAGSEEALATTEVAGSEVAYTFNATIPDVFFSGQENAEIHRRAGSDGQSEWKYTGISDAIDAGDALVGGGSVYFCSALANEIAKVAKGDGSQQWFHSPSGTSWLNALALSGDGAQLYHEIDAGVRAIDAADPTTTLWETNNNTADSTRTMAASGDGSGMVIGGGDDSTADGYVGHYDEANGSEDWWTTPHSATTQALYYTQTGDAIYSGNDTGELLELDPADGSTVRTFGGSLGDIPDLTADNDEAFLFVIADDFVKIDLSDFSEVWRRDASTYNEYETVTVGPNNEAVFTAETYQEVAAWDFAGNQLWTRDIGGAAALTR